MKSFQASMLLRNLIKDIPKNKTNIKIAGISADSNKIKKNFIFLLLKEKKTTVKILLMMPLKKEHL